MWFVWGALAAPTLEVVGDDLLLLEHLPAIEAAWGGRATLRRVTEVPAVTRRSGATGGLQTLLPAGTVVEEGGAATLVLGLDMDRGAAPVPTPNGSLHGRSFDLQGFVGRELRIEVRIEGCCGAEHRGRDVWFVEPGAQRVGYNVSLGWDREVELREALDAEGLGAQFIAGLLQPSGRRVHLAAREDPPLRPVVFGRTSPQGGAPVELTLHGVELVPQPDGWRFVVDEQTGRALCDRGVVPLEVVVPGRTGPRRARLDGHAVLCDNRSGEVLDGARAQVAWAADGSTAALWATSPSPMGFWDGQALPLPVTAPALELLASTAPTPTHPTSISLRALGYPVVRHGASAGKRTSAQVFYAPGLEVEAKELAARLGATVAPLDWQAAGELVVALP